MTLTEKVCRKILADSFSDLPREAVIMVKRAVQDCIGCAVAGTGDPAGEKILHYLGDTGAKGECTVISSWLCLPPAEAALANGVLAHALDYDDVNNASIAHTSVVLVPAAMAVCEKVRASGSDLILAYAAGFEMIARLGRAMLPEHYEHGWHSTSTLGVMGAATAAGKLLRLGPREMGQALGIAASFASGTQQNFGTMTKPLHAGHAARSGVMAALIAKEGFTAEPDILAQGYSFARVFGAGRVPDLSTVAENWANPWELLESGITIKRYPCCAGNHSSLDVMLKLVKDYDIKPEEVRKITCEVPGLVIGILHRHKPRTAAEARFSLEFAMAAAVKDRAAGLHQYTDSKVNDPLIRAVMKRVEQSQMTQELMAELRGGDLKGSRITVQLSDGRKIQGQTGEARGHPGDPLTDEELEAKFRECTEGILPDENTGKALILLARLENLDEISKLTNLFRKKA
jgi:2-methylcitrate dehydratase PrpD